MKEIKTLLDSLWKDTPYTLEKMEKGLTNHNYRLHTDQKDYIVRVPRKECEHIINRYQEQQVEQMVSALSVPLFYFDAKSGIKISEYIDGLCEFQECDAPDKIVRCAKLMKQLHSLPAPSFSFDAFHELENYRSHVHHPIYDLSEYENDIKKVAEFHNPKVLSHNDWVSGNILLGEKRDYLIDYEYAAANDPLFDVISFLGENQIFEESLRKQFYDAYFEEMNDTIKEQLFLWEIFQDVLWCNWAMMMWEARKEEIYLTIAKDKYEALKKLTANH